MSVQDRLATNKAAGHTAERLVQELEPALGLVPDDVAEHYDAVATTLITPDAALPFVGICLLERGTLVEIKSAVARNGNGDRGRFYLRRRQHEQLLADAGVYCFAVCADDTARALRAVKIVPATLVDDLLSGRGWIDGGNRSSYAQLAWSRLFTVDEVAPASGGGSP